MKLIVRQICLCKGCILVKSTQHQLFRRTHPSFDFLGLILLNLCFPNFTPTRYANVSVPQAEIRINQIKYFPFPIPYSIDINDKKTVI